MAKPKVFVSSTCYDLGVVRSELRHFIVGLGFEPVMSDHSDILYDPKLHTHDSCVAEVGSSDLLVLIIGSRLGGKALPSAKALIDWDGVDDRAAEKRVLKLEDRLSITQLEAIRAIEIGVPIYAFIQADVIRDHHLYERNKSKKDIIGKIDFPSIDKRETAEYIFEFINYIRSRSTNNSIFEFQNVEDIRESLRSQWAQLFQRLLNERLTAQKARQEFRSVSAQIEDLKAALLTSIGNNQLKETAKGVVKYRRLIDFLSGILSPIDKQRILSDIQWEDLLELSGIDYLDMRSFDGSSRSELVLVRRDQTFFRYRASIRSYQKLIADWQEFRSLDDVSREAVFQALLEASDSRPNMMIRYYDTPIDEYLEGLADNRGLLESKRDYEMGPTLGEILSEALKKENEDEDESDEP